MHPSVEHLRSLELPEGDWALFGSGPLLLRGWIDAVGDLDVITRGEAWERCEEIGEVSLLEDGNPVADLGVDVTAGRTWLYAGLGLDEMIDSAEDIDGIPCVRLEYVIAYKEAAGRPKDLRHLATIRDRHKG